MKKNFKFAFSIFTICIIMAATTSVSLAVTTLIGSWGNYTINGYTYADRSTLDIYSSGSVQARTFVGNKASGSIPTGYMGAKAIMYNSAGTAVKTGQWVYNSSPLYGMEVYVQQNLLSGTVYSRGVSAAWNGSSYTTHYTSRTPNYTAGTLKMNANGETYGSAAYINSIQEQPDLIAAKGIDGTFGYVRKEDFYGDMPKSPTEALHNSVKSCSQIPLYASDGKTVIGAFEISTSSVVKLSDKNLNSGDYLKMISE